MQFTNEAECSAANRSKLSFESICLNATSHVHETNFISPNESTEDAEKDSWFLFENIDEPFEETDDFQFENVTDFCLLHPNTDCAVSDAFLMVYAYFIRHTLNWTGLEDLIRLINCIVGDEKLPPSKHIFKRKFKRIVKCVPVVHFTCHNCGLYLGKLQDINSANRYSNCSTEIEKDTKFKKNHFISIPFENHLKLWLEQNSEHLNYDFRPPVSHICDVHDSLSFQNMRSITRNESILTLTFSTDGAAVFKSTKDKSLWPLQFIVNEIDLEHRFKRENIFCTAISFGKKPNMLVFFKPFIDEINRINTNGGLTFKMQNGETKTVKIVPMIFTGDSLARADKCAIATEIMDPSEQTKDQEMTCVKRKCKNTK